MKFILASAIAATVFLNGAASEGAADPQGCMVQLSLVPCEGTLRTITVAQSGTAHFRTIQQALNSALPGDTIVVRAGNYSEPVVMAVNGTPAWPISLRAHTGERPVIEPQGENSYVSISGSWLVLDGFEIRKGRHGVVVTGSNNIIRNNYVHDSDADCGLDYCGQGIIVASARDVVIQNNQIERNGLASPSPWHLHGIYLSDYHRRGVSRISILGNVVRDHGGAGIHIWNATNVTKDVSIHVNRLESNAVELIMTNVENVRVEQNTILHGSYPATNAPETAMLWLEFGRTVVFESNIFRYGTPPSDPLRGSLIHFYRSDLDGRELTWKGNNWELLPIYPSITDDDVRRALE